MAARHLGLWEPAAERQVLLGRVFKRDGSRGPKRRETEYWTIGISDAFRKAVAPLEKKLQGRVLEALTELAEHPLGQRGDTIKPLDGELKGMWRYRIGDYRLIYRPDIAAHVVMLLDLLARGDAYAS
jgi:mRNA-degrading endonuclease RelE of RelBE toxin-antitoxin system